MGESLWDNVWDINIINGIIWLILNRYSVWLLISGWWLTYPSEKWWISSVGMMTFLTEWKVIKAMFQTTNPDNYMENQRTLLMGFWINKEHMAINHSQSTDIMEDWIDPIQNPQHGMIIPHENSLPAPGSDVSSITFADWHHWWWPVQAQYCQRHSMTPWHFGINDHWSCCYNIVTMNHPAIPTWHLYTNDITLWWTYKKLLKMAIEIVDFPIKNGGSFHGKMLVHQRVSPNFWNLSLLQVWRTKIHWNSMPWYSAERSWF